MRTAEFLTRRGGLTRPVAHDAVNGKRGEAGGPQARDPGASPDEGEEHRGGYRGEGVEVNGVVPVAFDEREEGAGQAAQRAIEAGQPVKGTQPPSRLGRGSVVVERDKDGGEGRGRQSASMVRWSNPTISW